MARPASTYSRAFTLIEMLVVITILSIVAVGTIAVIEPALESRRVREAARGINVFFGTARNHAVASGRPCGVLIRRLAGQEDCGIALEQVEIPPGFSGETLDARAQAQITSAMPPVPGSIVTVKLTFVAQQNMVPILVKRGDLAQLNQQGPFYTIENATAGGLDLSLDLSRGVPPPPWPAQTDSEAIPFEIFRSPVKTASAPFQLPAGTVIDLNFCGTETNFSELLPAPPSMPPPPPALPVYIMFSPNGSVDKCYLEAVAGAGLESFRATERIYLMVGKRENVPPGVTPNWADFDNVWITLHPRTGLVTTSEVASAANIDESRRFAREAQGMGGR